MNMNDKLEIVNTIANEQLVITQCQLIAINASMKSSRMLFKQKQNIVTENQAVLEFSLKISGFADKLKNIIIKITETIIHFIGKIVSFIKSLVRKILMFFSTNESFDIFEIMDGFIVNESDSNTWIKNLNSDVITVTNGAIRFIQHGAESEIKLLTTLDRIVAVLPDKNKDELEKK